VSQRIYTVKPATRALTPTGGFLSGFAYSLNPYVGCAFGDAGGCPFCYVRMLPVAKAGHAPWGAWVIAKSNLAEKLEAEVAALEKSGRLERTTIFMSSATDPYQGLERHLRLSRAALEVLARYPIRRVLVQTRSPLVERDLDLLRVLGPRVIVSISIETDDDTVRRAITPTSPSVARRFTTARRLREAGIFVQLAIAPMMPNDAEHFATLAADAADRVVIDTYFAGDGASGARSRALGIGALYQKHGYDRWFEPGAEADLLAAMRDRLGPDRVLFSRAGFNAV
jgi:DNA repair photolyase